MWIKQRKKIEKKAKRKRIKDLDYEQEACEVARKIITNQTCHRHEIFIEQE